ncbi:MAG TPA: double zinc ribbon domain-containing protein, partial [Pseudothauera hydrothermalis]|nr:double zinc ribbon domain-containing protein [Pseudothauera hydrothermalis]
MNIPTSAESLSNQNIFRRLLRTVANYLIPQDCFVCGSVAGGQAVCPDCLAELPRQPALACPICALPTPDGLVCGHCLSAPPAFD